MVSEDGAEENCSEEQRAQKSNPGPDWNIDHLKAETSHSGEMFPCNRLSDKEGHSDSEDAEFKIISCLDSRNTVVAWSSFWTIIARMFQASIDTSSVIWAGFCQVVKLLAIVTSVNSFVGSHLYWIVPKERPSESLRIFKICQEI